MKFAYSTKIVYNGRRKEVTVVTFTEMKEELLKDPEVKKEYDALKDEELPSAYKLYDTVILGCRDLEHQKLAYEWISDPANKMELQNPYVEKALLFFDDTPVDDALGYGRKGRYYVDVVTALDKEGGIYEFETKRQVDRFVRKLKIERVLTVKRLIDVFFDLSLPDEGTDEVRVIPIVKDEEVVYTITHNERVIKDEVPYDTMIDFKFADDIYEIVDAIGENIDGYRIVGLYWVEDHVVECTLKKNGRKSAPIGISVNRVKYDLFPNIQRMISTGPKYLKRWFDKE